MLFLLLPQLLASLFPVALGWLALIPLLTFCIRRFSWRELCVWCVGLVAGHVWWIGVLAYRHMSAPLLGAVALYLLIVIWLGLCTYLFWWVVGCVPRVWPNLFLPLYFYLLAHCATPFLSGVRGYPFANPVLPLVAWCGKGCHPGAPFGHQSDGRTRDPAFADLVHYGGAQSCDLLRPTKPGCGRAQRATFYNVFPIQPLTKKSRLGRAQELLKRISAVPALPGNKLNLIVAPESTITHPLHDNDPAMSWWREALPANAILICGACLVGELDEKQLCEKPRNDEKRAKPARKFFQGAIILSKRPIIAKRKKHNCVDFFESGGEKRWFSHFLQKMVGWQTHDFTPSARPSGAVMIKGVRVQVWLCAEVLWAPATDADVYVVLVNETWFMGWVQELFFAAIRWRFCFINKPFAVVGHGRVWGVCLPGPPTQCG